MYSADQRIEIWRKFNQCALEPVDVEYGDEILTSIFTCPSGIEVALCKVKDQGHHLRRDLRDHADSLAIDFLLKHKLK